MYKIFTTRYGKDPILKIDELRKEYPKYKYLGGIRKDVRGIFIIKDMDCKQYSESWELDNGDIFYAPTPANLDKIKADLTKYKSEKEGRIKITLSNKVDLEIFPASAYPKKIYFTKKNVKSDNPYDCSFEYGKAAYDIWNLTQKEEKIMLDDPRILNFIKMGLKESYVFPEPLWDALDVISPNDFDKLFATMLGLDFDYLRDEVEKSTAASPQMTGASVA